MSRPSLTPVPGSPPWHGGEVDPGAYCLLAPNPGPMTLDGTNTWVIGGPGEVVVIDPGPDTPRHLQDVLARVHRLGGVVREVLLTHGHLDHSAGAARFAALAGGVRVRALDPAHVLGDEGVTENDVIGLDLAELRVLHTPGHTHDSLTFVLHRDLPTGPQRDLLTGDTVLGRGTTVVAHPDGRLGPYLHSLTRLRDLAEAAEAMRVLPGHGPVLDDAAAVLEAYLAHRHERLDQVRDALAQLPGDQLSDLPPGGTADRVLELVYADVPKVVWPAARLSVLAQLEYLADHGRRAIT